MPGVKSQISDLWTEIVIATVTDVFQLYLSYPAEYVKTKMHLDHGKKKQFTGMMDIIKKVMAKDGITGFYKGGSVVLIGTVPQSLIGTLVFEELKRRAVDKEGEATIKIKMLCGMWAGVGEAVLVGTPMETIKTKMIDYARLGTLKSRRVYAGVSQIIADSGLRGLYQGVTPTVIRQGSSYAVRIWALEKCKEWYKGEDKKKHVPLHLLGVFGIVAGVAATMCNAPIDIVKTRMQGVEAYIYKNTVDCIIKIWKFEGPAAYYKGTVARLFRNCLDVSMFVVLEEFFGDLLTEGHGEGH